MHLTERFYSAFQQRDWSTMGACYHEEARFSDPVFRDLDATAVRAMWKMLLTSGTDLRISYMVIEENASSATVRWEAWYTFNKTKRPVHNSVISKIVLRDGLIIRQTDTFNFWKWSRQALGATGVLLGWTGILRNKVRRLAAKNLETALLKH